MAKIFIGFTPLHAQNVEEILREMHGEVFCLFTKKWPETERSYKRLGFSLPSKGVARGFLYILNFIFFSLKIRRIIKSKAKVELYIPHPNNIFTNYLFFCPEIAEVNIYEDGILNYYDAPTGSKKPNVFLRLLSSACALPYSHYSGHLSGCDAKKITSGYFSRPDFAVSIDKFSKIIKLSYQKQIMHLDQQRILFLDQDTALQIGEAERQKLLCNMFETFPPESYKYYYKPHHEYEASTGMNNLPENLKYLAAEKVIDEIKPGIVISFFSSALINIKQISPEIRCISLAAERVQVTVNGEQKTLGALFLAAGVECV